MNAQDMDEKNLEDMYDWLSDEVCACDFDPRSASDQQIVEATDEFYPGGVAGFLRDN